eukprot:TRINITY_DN1146_c0_g1_i1.p1 TRINITY_DN1146_c0_g1~~TRINITY_DN1146_c0_g1_i1.p1  ORF type:complete len:670 (-),score=112.68 TRINITY_DN1146_c0_g1_i1:1738-3747(-)
MASAHGNVQTRGHRRSDQRSVSEKEDISLSKDNRNHENQRQGSQSKDKGKREEKHMLSTAPTTEQKPITRHSSSGGFLFGCEVSITKLTLFRFVFYSLFAIDSWIQLTRTYKFDGDFQKFNVGHFHSLFPITSPPSEGTSLYEVLETHGSDYVLSLAFYRWVLHRVLFPSRIAMEFGWLVRVFVSVRVAFGEAARWESVLLSVITAYQYFISQIDNYQHHYLLVLLCFILSTIDWSSLGEKLEEQLKQRVKAEKGSAKQQRGKAALLSNQITSVTDSITTTTVWQFRLLVLQLSVVYFWTAVAKMDATWLSGVLFSRMIGPRMVATIEWTISLLSDFGLHNIDSVVWSAMSYSTLVIELYLVVALQIRAFDSLTLVAGLMLHMMFALGQLQIGLFSYYMLGIYLLTLPDIVTAKLEKLHLLLLRYQYRLIPTTKHWLIGFSASICLGVALCIALVDLDSIAIVMAVVSLLVLTSELLFQTSTKQSSKGGEKALFRGCLHLATCIIISLVVVRSTTTLVKMYSDGGNDRAFRNDLAGAVELLNRAIKQENGAWFAPDQEIHCNMGFYYEHMRRYDDAFRTYYSVYGEGPNGNVGFAKWSVKGAMGVISHYDRLNDSNKVCRVFKEIQQLVIPHEMKELEGCQHEECGRRRSLAQNVLKRSTALARKHSCG